jgi:RNA polymerase sigma-70 factor (ECF subfamily)
VNVVYRYVLLRVGDRCVAEDLTSETFLRALRRISSVSYRGRDIGAWFVTIARNLVLDYVKSGRYRLEVASAEPREPPQSGHTPETAMLTGQTNDELMRCIRALGPDQRECVTLRFLSGLSVAEAAEVMGRGEGAIKALQHRAVRRLAQLLPADIR